MTDTARFDSSHAAHAMGELVVEAFDLLAIVAANKAAGAKARGDLPGAERYDKMRQRFTDRPHFFLTVELSVSAADGAEVEIHIAEG